MDHVGRWYLQPTLSNEGFQQDEEPVPPGGVRVTVADEHQVAAGDADMPGTIPEAAAVGGRIKNLVADRNRQLLTDPRNPGKHVRTGAHGRDELRDV